MISFFKNIFKAKVSGGIVLMYHRISPNNSDPWDLCVSPENFEDHVRAIKDKYRIVPVYRMAERIRQNESLDDIIAITFDDGYLDNYTNAKPILEKYNVPAAFYITAKFKSDKKFWWDELEQLILHTPELPESVNLSLNRRNFRLILGEASVLTDTIREQNKVWRYGKEYPNSRIKLYYELWAEIKTMTLSDQKTAMQQIKGWAGLSVVNTPMLMNETQIREMSESGLFEIGAHTVNHPALGVLSSAEQHFEIRQSKADLENIVAQTLMGFAYPYGHYNVETPVLTKSLEFRYALTTEEKKVTHQNSIYEIPRFQVKDIASHQLISNIETWKSK